MLCTSYIVCLHRYIMVYISCTCAQQVEHILGRSKWSAIELAYSWEDMEATALVQETRQSCYSETARSLYTG